MKLGIQFFGIETSEDTREKMKRAFGFDEPPVTEKLKRADFGSDEEYFDAAARLAMQNHDPAYRAEYARIRREYTARKQEEEAAADALLEQMTLEERRQQRRSTRRKSNRLLRTVFSARRNSSGWTMRPAAAPRLTLPLGRFPSSRLAQPWPPTPRS